MSAVVVAAGLELRVGEVYVPPDGPHAGHPVLLRKVWPAAHDPQALLGASECARCRQRWTWIEGGVWARVQAAGGQVPIGWAERTTVTG